MRVAACAVILRQNRVLLGRRSQTRSYYPGAWDLFGGHVEPFEQPEATIIRELTEELGIVAVQPKLLCIAPEPRPDTHGLGEFHVFLVTDWIGEPNLNNEEHERIAWFSQEEISGLNLADNAIIALLNSVFSR